MPLWGEANITGAVCCSGDRTSSGSLFPGSVMNCLAIPVIYPFAVALSLVCIVQNVAPKITGDGLTFRKEIPTMVCRCIFGQVEETDRD